MAEICSIIGVEVRGVQQQQEFLDGPRSVGGGIARCWQVLLGEDVCGWEGETATSQLRLHRAVHEALDGWFAAVCFARFSRFYR